MSKLSIKIRETKRMKMVVQYASKRTQLKLTKQYNKLDMLPRDSSPVRLNNRCRITGRKRSYMRKFGVSRIIFNLG